MERGLGGSGKGVRRKWEWGQAGMGRGLAGSGKGVRREGTVNEPTPTKITLDFYETGRRGRTDEMTDERTD